MTSIQTQSHVHVVSKHDVKDHTVVPASNGSLPPLAPSSVRVQTKLVGLTSNNLTYARGGHRLHWWDTWPVPSFLPEPYNNTENWGIVPAWGYGEVQSSTIDALPPGTLFFGYWPLSSLPVDLQLEAANGLTGLRWTETSPHRAQLMTFYNVYELIPPAVSSTLSDITKATTVLFKPLYQASYFLNLYTFPPDPSTKPIDPLGMGLPWSPEDADLTSSLIISLASNSKTARPFAWQLTHNRDTTTAGPLGLINVSSHPTPLPQPPPSPLPVSTLTYTALTSDLSWLHPFLTGPTPPNRLVILDFGAPASTVNALQHLIETTPLPHPLTPTSTHIGPQPTPAPSVPKLRETSRHQFNTSTVRDAAAAATRGHPTGLDALIADADGVFARYAHDEGLSAEVERAGVQDGFAGDAGRDGICAAWRGVVVAGETRALMAFRV